jgi:hypothetical protein
MRVSKSYVVRVDDINIVWEKDPDFMGSALATGFHMNRLVFQHRYPMELTLIRTVRKYSDRVASVVEFISKGLDPWLELNKPEKDL